MSSHGLRTLTLFGATMAMGLAAGVFDLYAHTIMPGLRKTDDRTFVASFQALDRAIINPWFIGGTFLGALVLTSGALLADRGNPTAPWVAVALAGYAVAVVITFAVHLPLNDAIKAAGDPATVDVSVVRAQFHESRWVAWNLVRALTSTGAFACLTWALIVGGGS